MLVEADPVIEKQPVLATVQASLTVVERPLVRGKILRFAVDVGAADHLVDGVALIHHTAERAGAQGEFVAQAAGIEASAERCLHLIVAPGIVRAAEVVEVVVALRAEVVGHCHAGATGRAVATPGKRTVVIDHYLAARGAEVACPGVAEAVLEIAVEVQRVRGHRFRTALVGQQLFRRGVVRQACATEQLITRCRALLPGLVLQVQLQQRGVADVPVEGQGGEVALPVGVFDIGVDVFMGQVGPQSELLLAAEPAADVGGQVTAAAVIGGDRHRAYVGWALGHVVDQPTGLGSAALQAGKALEQLHLLLVFQADILLAGHGAAVDPVAAGRVQREAAHHEVLVVTDRRIAFPHRGVVPQHLAEQAGLLILDQGFVEHRNRRRGIEQGGRLDARDRGAVDPVAGTVFARHVDRWQFGTGGPGRRYGTGQ
ncbi:hypothetical protein D3C85_949490 [compost metagenome]